MRSQPVRLGRRIIPVIAIALLTAGTVTTLPATATAASPAPWQMMGVPTPPEAQGGTFTSLKAVAAVSATEVWAGGLWSDAAGRWQAQLLGWNGTSWSAAALPTTSDAHSEITAIDASPTTRAWAAGSVWPVSGEPSKALLLLRAGGSWAKFPVPTTGAGDNRLLGIDMANPASGLAVGSYQPVAGVRDSQNLVLRWNGSSWRQMPVPSKATGINKLTAVTFDSPNTAWAVGSWAPSNDEFAPKETIILRWTGRTWIRWPSPNPSPDAAGSSNSLNNVIAVSSGEVWATGQTSAGGWMARRPLTLRWTGGAWTEVTASVHEPLAWEFTDAHVVSPTEIYFVGYKRGITDFQDHDFIRRWDGTQFVPETLAMPPANDGGSGDRIVSALSGISGLPTGQLFAVGHVFYKGNHVLTKNINP